MTAAGTKESDGLSHSIYSLSAGCPHYQGSAGGVGVKHKELGVANIAGMLAISVIVLGGYAFVALMVLDLLGIVDGHRLTCDWHITC